MKILIFLISLGLLSIIGFLCSFFIVCNFFKDELWDIIEEKEEGGKDDRKRL